MSFSELFIDFDLMSLEFFVSISIRINILSLIEIDSPNK